MKTTLASILVASTLVAVGAEFHVELKGNDSNPGTAQKPFATVERAVEALKGVRKASAEPVTIRIGAGRHELTRTIRLSAADTTGPVVFKGAGQGKTILFTSMEVPEIRKVADLCHVFYNGSIIGTLSNDQIDETSVMRYSTNSIGAQQPGRGGEL